MGSPIEFQFARRGHEDVLIPDGVVPPVDAQVSIDGQWFTVLQIEFRYSTDPAEPPSRVVVTLE